MAREVTTTVRERLCDAVEEARAVEEKPCNALVLLRRQRQQVAHRASHPPQAFEKPLRGPRKPGATEGP